MTVREGFQKLEDALKNPDPVLLQSGFYAQTLHDLVENLHRARKLDDAAFVFYYAEGDTVPTLDTMTL
jgi:hypothetical protein